MRRTNYYFRFVLQAALSPIPPPLPEASIIEIQSSARVTRLGQRLLYQIQYSTSNRDRSSQGLPPQEQHPTQQSSGVYIECCSKGLGLGLWLQFGFRLGC